MIRVAILWHMHQPLYKDPRTQRYELPWTRMHALKDYYGMVRLAEEFPSLHLTFNLVPSLLMQIQDYANGTAVDPFWELARRPAEELDRSEREFVLRYFFQAHPKTMIGRFPRYAELLEKFRQVRWDAGRAARLFTNQELRDLQVLSQLAWFDEYFREEEPARSLIEQGLAYSLEDQAEVCELQTELIQRVIPAYRKARERGQVELSVTPLYHPILPLICDTSVASESRPDVRLPRSAFRQPDDAREQLQRARALYRELFGEDPAGLWPSEGSVSDEVARIASEQGFRWLATDEGVLGRSLGVKFARDEQGEVIEAERLYRPYVFTGTSPSLYVFFRDHNLSDLIGFVYSSMDAEKAAEDFVQRIRSSCRPAVRKGADALVAVILDGENAWEHYEQSGRPFLRALYRRLTSSPDIATCTFSEACGLPASDLSHLVPGSWINANFDVWIGAEEDNRSWDLLAAARRVWQSARDASPGTLTAALELSREALLAAEGSDWNWWYGPEHQTENLSEFDSLYRGHLSMVYTALGQAPPASLLVPIFRLRHAAAFQPATKWIQPHIDGRVSSYFEWMGAAEYHVDRRTSTMSGKEFTIAALLAGYNGTDLFLRLDYHRPLSELTAEIKIDFNTGAAALSIHLLHGQLQNWQWTHGGETRHPDGVIVAAGKILEAQLPRALLSAALPNAPVTVSATVYVGSLPIQVVPAEGALTLELSSEQTLQEV